jgi:hypothetical protein
MHQQGRGLRKPSRRYARWQGFDAAIGIQHHGAALPRHQSGHIRQ